jgi:ABC-type polysaccharide/polyol phosphate export permease
MFGTAVVYPIRGDSFSPTALFVLRLNPMTPILDAYRDLVLYGRLPALGAAWPAIVVVLLVFWLGIWSFARLQFLFAERV